MRLERDFTASTATCGSVSPEAASSAPVAPALESAPSWPTSASRVATELFASCSRSIAVW